MHHPVGQKPSGARQRAAYCLQALQAGQQVHTPRLARLQKPATLSALLC
jgi:hypothetical protein